MSLVDRLLYHHGRVARNGDQQHTGVAPTQANGHAEPDMLPLDQAPQAECQTCSVLVAVTGGELDHELMALACAVAKKKNAQVVHVVFGIEVPRTKPVDEDLPVERAKADQALDQAADDAKTCQVTVDKEYLQSRNIGLSLVSAATTHGSSLLIIGLPYKAEPEGQLEMNETVDYVLKHAPCRVWVIRGQPPASETEATSRAEQREPAGAASPSSASPSPASVY